MLTSHLNDLLASHFLFLCRLSVSHTNPSRPLHLHQRPFSFSLVTTTNYSELGRQLLAPESSTSPLAFKWHKKSPTGGCRAPSRVGHYILVGMWTSTWITHSEVQKSRTGQAHGWSRSSWRPWHLHPCRKKDSERSRLGSMTTWETTNLGALKESCSGLHLQSNGSLSTGTDSRYNVRQRPWLTPVTNLYQCWSYHWSSF